MAEPDAAGLTPAKGPTRSWSLSLANVQRDVERSTAPLRAAMEQAERSMAPFRAAAEQAERSAAPFRAAAEQAKRYTAAIESGFGLYLREMLGEEVSAAPRPPFRATELPRPTAGPNGPIGPNAVATTPPPPPPAILFPGGDVPFTVPPPAPPPALSPEEIRAALAPLLKELVADIKRTLAEPTKPQIKRGDSTSERLRNLFEEDPEFAICRTLTEIGARIGRAKSSISGRDCHYYHFKLKPLREKKAAAVSLAADDAARRLPSRKQAGRAMKAHLDWQAAIDDAIDRDGGSHLGTAT